MDVKTNFDVFKTMTVEQLSRAIARPCYCCAYDNSSERCQNGRCSDGIREFLSKEASDGTTAETVMRDLGWKSYEQI